MGDLQGFCGFVDVFFPGLARSCGFAFRGICLRIHKYSVLRVMAYDLGLGLQVRLNLGCLGSGCRHFQALRHRVRGCSGMITRF